MSDIVFIPYPSSGYSEGSSVSYVTYGGVVYVTKPLFNVDMDASGTISKLDNRLIEVE